MDAKIMKPTSLLRRPFAKPKAKRCSMDDTSRVSALDLI